MKKVAEFFAKHHQEIADGLKKFSQSQEAAVEQLEKDLKKGDIEHGLKKFSQSQKTAAEQLEKDLKKEAQSQKTVMEKLIAAIKKGGK